MRWRRPATRVDPLLLIWPPFSRITNPVSARAVLYPVCWSKIDASYHPAAVLRGRS
jgi:hypothetical protein